MPFTNTIKSQTNFNVSELTGYYEYYEGKIGDDSAYLFLQKNLSECNFYTGYMYKKNSIKPIVFTGWEELINQDGLHISYHTYNGKKLYKREQIKTEMIILTNHSHTPEYLGEEFLLEGVRAKDSIEGYAYTFKIPTEKGIGEAFIFKKKQAQTFFDISFYPENTPFYLKRGNKIDTVLSQFGFDSFLPKSEGNIIVKEIESFLMPEWKSILKENTHKKTGKVRGNGYKWNFCHSTNIVYDKDGLLSIQLIYKDSIKSLNFIAGEKIELFNIVNLDNIPRLLKILKEKGINELKNVDHTRNGIDNIITSIVIEDNFSITPGGLLFTYTDKNHKFIYQIFGSLGLKLFVPYSEIKDLLSAKFIKQLNL